MIPVYGPARAAINDFQEGRYVWGAVNVAITASDFIVVKAAFTGLARGATKGFIKFSGSQTWEAHRKWLTRRGFREVAGQPFHHWLLERNQGIGKYVPGLIKHHPWNLMPMDSAGFHTWLHNANIFQKSWYGTPTWFKGLLVSVFGREANALRCQK